MNPHTSPGRITRRAWIGTAAVVAVSLSAYASVTLAGATPGSAPAAGRQASRGAQVTQAAALAGPSGALLSSSYLGGLEWDEATGVAADTHGNSYVTGFTLSEDFPRVGPGTRGHAAIVDAFVTKVAPDGRSVLWSTQIGGVDMDSSNAVAVDSRGGVYVVGRTGSPDFRTHHGLQARLRGRACTGEPCHDAFVVKLSRTGVVQWSTLFGGSRNEEAVSVAVGKDGAVYVAGLTDSPDLPVKGAFQRKFGSPPCPGDLPCPYDAFVTKLAPQGNRVVYSTYLGGSSSDVARGIAVDDLGNAYVAGSTGSADFPTRNAFQATTRGKACGPPPGEPCRQAFVTKLRRSGATVAFSTYLGGKEHDDAYGVAVDRAHRVYVTGSTQSTDFPVRKAFQRSSDNRGCTSEQPHELCDDGFVTAFTATGRALRFSTYLGGRAEDQGLGVAVTRQGTALVAGRTDSADFPVTRGAAQHAFGGYIDGFAAELTSGGSPVWTTFLGGSEPDRATGIAVGRNGAAHVVGRTLSPDFPTVRPFQRALRDEDYDAFTLVIG